MKKTIFFFFAALFMLSINSSFAREPNPCYEKNNDDCDPFPYNSEMKTIAIPEFPNCTVEYFIKQGNVMGSNKYLSII